MIVIQMQLAQTQLEVITAPVTLDSLEMVSTAQVCEGLAIRKSFWLGNCSHSSEFFNYRTHSKLRPPFCWLGLATSMGGLIIDN